MQASYNYNLKILPDMFVYIRQYLFISSLFANNVLYKNIIVHLKFIKFLYRMLQDNELYQEIADGMATYIKYKMYLMNKNTHQIQ